MNQFILYLPESIQLTNEQLLALCERNSHLRIETDTDQNLIIMSPASSKTGHYNSLLNYYFNVWNQNSKLGLVFDSSSGFRLPDGSVKSPDTSFISHERWSSLTEEQQDGFAEICPDFVLELRSRTDHRKELLQKMEHYTSNGCRMGWLIDPLDREVHIYRNDAEPEVLQWESELTLYGEAVLLNFELQLNELLVWQKCNYLKPLPNLG